MEAVQRNVGTWQKWGDDQTSFAKHNGPQNGVRGPGAVLSDDLT